MQVVHGADVLQPLRELHVDSLYPDHLTLLTQPVKLLSFDFNAPQAHQSCTVEVLFNHLSLEMLNDTHFMSCFQSSWHVFQSQNLPVRLCRGAHWPSLAIEP